MPHYRGETLKACERAECLTRTGSARIEVALTRTQLFRSLIDRSIVQEARTFQSHKAKPLGRAFVLLLLHRSLSERAVDSERLWDRDQRLQRALRRLWEQCARRVPSPVPTAYWSKPDSPKDRMRSPKKASALFPVSTHSRVQRKLWPSYTTRARVERLFMVLVTPWRVDSGTEQHSRGRASAQRGRNL